MSDEKTGFPPSDAEAIFADLKALYRKFKIPLDSEHTFRVDGSFASPILVTYNDFTPAWLAEDWNADIDKAFREILPAEIAAAFERARGIAATKVDLRRERQGRPGYDAAARRETLLAKETDRINAATGKENHPKASILPDEEAEFVRLVDAVLPLWKAIFAYSRKNPDAPIEQLQQEFGGPEEPLRRFMASRLAPYAPAWLLAKFIENKSVRRRTRKAREFDTGDDAEWTTGHKRLHAPRQKTTKRTGEYHFAALHAFALLKERNEPSGPSAARLYNQYYKLKKKTAR